jgi:hypothetical protein
LAPLEITVRNKVTRENIPTGTLFPTVISMGTLGNLFYCINFYWEPQFLESISQKIWFPSVRLEIIVIYEVHAEIFPPGTSFLVFFQRNLGEPYFCELIAREKGSQ